MCTGVSYAHVLCRAVHRRDYGDDSVQLRSTIHDLRFTILLELSTHVQGISWDAAHKKSRERFTQEHQGMLRPRKQEALSKKERMREEKQGMLRTRRKQEVLHTKTGDAACQKKRMGRAAERRAAYRESYLIMALRWCFWCVSLAEDFLSTPPISAIGKIFWNLSLKKRVQSAAYRSSRGDWRLVGEPDLPAGTPLLSREVSCRWAL